MLEERGIVIEVKDKFAIVQTQRVSSCGQCAANQNCGTASLATVLGQKTTQVKVLNYKGAKVGDKVVIGLEEQVLLKSSLALYLIPLVGLFVAAIGYDMLAALAQLPDYEIFTVLAGLLGLLSGLRWVKRVTIKMSEDTRFQPMIVKAE